MSRSTRGDKEYTRLQEALHENGKLKRENASLRKQLARLDLDRHSYVKDIVDEHLANEERGETTLEMVERLKEEWRCHECKTGFLEVIPFSKAGKTWYIRQCNNCTHRTQSKPYDPQNVKGPLKINPK